MIDVKIVNKSNNPLPVYGTSDSAGMDLRAHLDKPVEIAPGQRILISTGIFVKLPVGHEAQIRPRSGLAIKHGITVLNSPGTIDADYTGEIKVILINLGQESFQIKNGERICQMIISKYQKINWQEVNMLEETQRGAGGFGHTGTT